MKRFSLSLLTVASFAWGWGDLGHQTVADIAESLLTEQARNLVAQTIAEPLAVAATFPDQVRSDSRYNGYEDGFSLYHFVTLLHRYDANHKFVRANPPKVDSRSADTIITLGPRYILDGLDEPHSLKVGLWMKYLIHLVGDVHQPLHVGSGWDRGANLCDVTWIDPDTQKKIPKNLHSVIDENIFEYSEVAFQKSNKNANTRGKRWFGYKELRKMIEAQVPHTADESTWAELAAMEPQVWYNESNDLHPSFYPDYLVSNHKLTPKTRPYCKYIDPDYRDPKSKQLGRTVSSESYDPELVPVLTRQFSNRVLPIAYRQIYLAGRRLAYQLNEIAKEASKQGRLQSDAEKTFLRELQEARISSSMF